MKIGGTELMRGERSVKVVNKNDCRLYSNIRIISEPHTGVRYTSGLFVYDEVFSEGRLLGRYWSSVGRIIPELHFGHGEWLKEARILPADAFEISINNRALTSWQLVKISLEEDCSELRGETGSIRCAAVHLTHPEESIDVKVHTRIDGTPFMTRWLQVKNKGERPVAISSVFPWTGMIWSHRFREYAGFEVLSPFDLGYNHQFTAGREGDFQWENLQEGKRVIDGGTMGKSGWGRPGCFLHDRATGEYFVAELGWSGNWVIEVGCTVTHPKLPVLRTHGGKLDIAKQEATLTFKTGPNSADPALRVLSPEETINTPAVHFGLMRSDFDTCVQSVHKHIRDTVLPTKFKGDDLFIEANHRGYISDHEDEEGIKREIDIAKKIGTELFMVDAGWFGREPNKWALNVGDWHAGSWLPNGLEPIGEYAREKGLRFGLWVEIEAIGSQSRLREEHPDWILTRDGEPVADGRHLDMTKPEVVEWMESEIARIIQQYGLDLFRIDYNTTIKEGGNRNIDGFIENSLWRQCEAIYGIFDRLRKKFPHVIFENCAGGGGRLDLGILRRFELTEISDWLRMPRGLKILYGLTTVLPPEICLRTFGTECAEHELDGDIDSQLRFVCLARPIFRGVSPSLEELNPILLERIRHYTSLYKSFIRPILPDCQVYHHNGALPITDPTPWCTLEYVAADKSRAVVGIFRTAEIEDSSYLFKSRGINPGYTYQLTFDSTGEKVKISGLELIRDGVSVLLENNGSSELLLLETLAHPIISATS